MAGVAMDQVARLRRAERLFAASQDESLPLAIRGLLFEAAEDIGQPRIARADNQNEQMYVNSSRLVR